MTTSTAPFANGAPSRVSIAGLQTWAAYLKIYDSSGRELFFCEESISNPMNTQKKTRKNKLFPAHIFPATSPTYPSTRSFWGNVMLQNTSEYYTVVVI